MHILVTNDDGVFAPGLQALAQALRDLGKVTVVAPDKNWSACGHAKTLTRPIRVEEVSLADGSPAFACDGAPSDCVALACLGMIEEKIDMVVSGINPNANLGHDITYSGTVTAAMEAIIWKLPGIAVSVDSPNGHEEPIDFSLAAHVGARVAKMTLEHTLPENVLLNVNVPYVGKDALKGIQVTRQGIRKYRDKLLRRADPHGKPYYWIGGDPPVGVPQAGTDAGALAEGYVSITPLTLDLTAYDHQETFTAWNFT